MSKDYVCGAEYSWKQFSRCFARVVSALNFNDTSVKDRIGCHPALRVRENGAKEVERDELSSHQLQRRLTLCVFVPDY